MGADVPTYTRNEIVRRAKVFLGEHHPDGTPPIPIDAIAEFKLGLDIVPVQNLLRRPRGINGFLSSDRKTIYVDEYVMMAVENRFRFTVAHEIGHLVLHGESYSQFKSDHEWEKYRADLSPLSVARAETQADQFAGLVLVPKDALPEVLRAAFVQRSAEVRRKLPRFDFKDEMFWSLLAGDIGKKFGVAEITAEIRLKNDGLWQKEPDTA